MSCIYAHYRCLSAALERLLMAELGRSGQHSRFPEWKSHEQSRLAGTDPKRTYHIRKSP
jgi:hypothetical protein